MKPLFLLTLALSLLTGCQEAPKHFYGRTGMIVLKEPLKIEAWRVHGGDGTPQAGATPQELNVKLASELAEILQDSSTYDFQMAKACKFDPIAGFRLTRDKRQIDVILCFACNEIKLISPDPVNRKYPSRVASFDPGRARLLAFVKKAFPNDPEIQAIK